jgi:hypothetical protein
MALGNEQVVKRQKTTYSRFMGIFMPIFRLSYLLLANHSDTF